MRRNTLQEREERSSHKYTTTQRPSYDVGRASDLGPLTEMDPAASYNSKRYSFMVRGGANSPSRRPLTSKNTFGNGSGVGEQLKQEEPQPRRYVHDERNDENTQKKYLSMTPTNARKQPPQPSGKKHSFVTASKPNYEETRVSQQKVSAFRPQPKAEPYKMQGTSGYKPQSVYQQQQQETRTPRSVNPRKCDQSIGSVQDFEVSENPRKAQQRYFEYIMRYSYRSKKGFIPNTQKYNQDAYIVAPNIAKKSWQHFFGICDGHGNNGHHVSSFIKNHLTQAITTSTTIEKNPCDSLYRAYKSTVEKLTQESKIDLSYSGSTVIGCYMLHDKLYCSNVGDSRAVVGRKDNKGNWVVQPISNDHKPCNQNEADRIIRGKGRIDKFKDADGNPVGPLRVWLKDSNGPGLAMTRSFGDLVAASVGVCWEPEIIEHTMTQQDRIILIASDGIWQFLQNDDIIGKLVPYYEANKIEEACDFLLEYSTASWNKECTIIDDISFVLIFMNYGG